MWPLCNANPWLWCLLPLLIGLMTGWWAWARSNNNADLAYSAPVPAANPVQDVEPIRVATPVVTPIAPVAAFDAPVVAPIAAPVVDTGSGSGIGLGLAGAAAAAMTAIGIPGAVGAPDDLLQIKGVGPKLNSLLNGLGIQRFDQIAAWGASEIDKVDDHLGAFKGRIGRDNWIEQAGLLAKGLIAEFEAKFGKLDSENK